MIKPTGFDTFYKFFTINKDGSGKSFFKLASFIKEDGGRVKIFRGPAIVQFSNTNPCVITCAEAHGFVANQKIVIQGVRDTVLGALVEGEHILTVTGSLSFTIPVDATGTVGSTDSGAVAGIQEPDILDVSSIGALIRGRLAIDEPIDPWNLPHEG